MTANKHTPGPWHSGFTKFSQVFAENGALIARCNRLTSLTNLQANARLIAAAPELLEAAMAFIAPFDGIEVVQGGYIAKARAAIAKATGGAA